MIHEKHRDFARAVVALARQHGMTGLEMSFRADFNSQCKIADLRSDDIKMIWALGRHGVENEIKLSASQYVIFSEKIKPEDN